MNILRLTIFTLIGMGLLFAGQAQAEPAQEEVNALLGAIKQIKAGDNLPEEQARTNREQSEKALALFAMDEVSRKALGKYWDKTPPEDQKKFSTLLGQLFVHVAFPNSAKFFAGLRMDFGKAEVEGSRAVVPMTVTHPEEGEVGIDFHLAKKDGVWRLVDVYLDEVSLRNNLRSQFYKVLAENDFKELLARMEKKLKEATT